MRAYDSGPRSPHTPLSQTPDDDPIFYRSPPGPPFFPLQPFLSVPLQYRNTHQCALRSARRSGRRVPSNLEEFKDQIFHTSQAALCLVLERFNPMGIHSPSLLRVISEVQHTWLMRILSTHPHELNMQTLGMNASDTAAYRTLIQSNSNTTFPFPLSTADDSTIFSGSTSCQQMILFRVYQHKVLRRCILLRGLLLFFTLGRRPRCRHASTLSEDGPY